MSENEERKSTQNKERKVRKVRKNEWRRSKGN